MATLRALSHDYETLHSSVAESARPRYWEMLKGFVKSRRGRRSPAGPADSAAEAGARLHEGIERLVRVDLPGLNDLLPRSEQWVFDVVRAEAMEPGSVFLPDPRRRTLSAPLPTATQRDAAPLNPRAGSDRVRMHVTGQLRDRKRTLVRVNDSDVLFSRGEFARLLLLVAARHSSDDGFVDGDELVRASRQKGNDDVDHSATDRAVYDLRRRLREGASDVPGPNVIVVESRRVRLGDCVEVTWDREALLQHHDERARQFASRLPDERPIAPPGGA